MSFNSTLLKKLINKLFWLIKLSKYKNSSPPPHLCILNNNHSFVKKNILFDMILQDFRL